MSTAAAITIQDLAAMAGVDELTMKHFAEGVAVSMTDAPTAETVADGVARWERTCEKMFGLAFTDPDLISALVG